MIKRYTSGLPGNPSPARLLLELAIQLADALEAAYTEA
jgi:hypothetical protein